MTKSSEGSGTGDLNGNAELEFYIFAGPAEDAPPLLDHVIYKMVGERIARGLCNLFHRTQGPAPGALCFRHRAAVSFCVEDQIILDHVLDVLNGYRHPDPSLYAVRPTAELMQRAQYVPRARMWERRLREKIRTAETFTLAAHTSAKDVPLASPVPLSSPSSILDPRPPAFPAPAAPLKIGRLEYLPDFSEVWVDGRRYNLKKRRPARRCIQYLVEQRAFAESSARHQLRDIHPFVIDGIGSCSATPKVHNYFNDRKRQLTELRQQLVKPVARTGRYYLAVG